MKDLRLQSMDKKAKKHAGTIISRWLLENSSCAIWFVCITSNVRSVWHYDDDAFAFKTSTLSPAICSCMKSSNKFLTDTPYRSVCRLIFKWCHQFFLIATFLSITFLNLDTFELELIYFTCFWQSLENEDNAADVSVTEEVSVCLFSCLRRIFTDNNQLYHLKGFSFFFFCFFFLINLCNVWYIFQDYLLKFWH